MITIKKYLAIVLLAAIGATGLYGCGGESPTATPLPPTATTAPPTDTPAPPSPTTAAETGSGGSGTTAGGPPWIF